MGVPAARSPSPPAPGRVGTFRALQHRAFRLLFVAFLINQTGFWISHISLQGLMVQLSNNDTRQNGLLFFFLFLPAFVLAPLAGVAADRFDRKRIVLSCYAMVALCTAGLAVATYLGWMTPTRLLVLAFVMGLSFAFNGPASMAIAANSVPKRDLASAVSLQSAANNLTRVAGPLLAAPLVAIARFDLSFGLYTLAAVVAGGLTLAMQIERYAPDAEEGGLLARMASGLSHARARRPALPALLTVAVLSYFGVSHTVLLPAYAADVLGSESYFVWLVAATGLGAMVGALQSGRDGRTPTLRAASVGLIAYGIALAGFAITSNWIVALITQLVVGYFYFAVMTGLQTLIQQIVDESKRGRVMSLFQVSWAGLVPFGSLSLGYLAGPLGTSTALLGAALICTFYGLVMTLLAPRLSGPEAS